jgi:transcriptional regulator with XRE-family HTH domain
LSNREGSHTNLIGLGLKEFRESQKLTLKEMAEKINSSAGYISEVERGKKIPGSNMILSLKRNFGRLDLNKLFSIKHKDDPILNDLTIDSAATEEEEIAALKIIESIEQGPWSNNKKIKLIDSVCTVFGMEVD